MIAAGRRCRLNPSTRTKVHKPKDLITSTQKNARSIWKQFLAREREFLAGSVLLRNICDVRVPTLFKMRVRFAFRVWSLPLASSCWTLIMFASLRVSCMLALYATFVAATALACHSLLHATATNIAAKPQIKTAAAAPAYSRVELWRQKQSSGPTKPATLIQAAGQTAVPAPERDLAHAIVLAAALDSAEHNLSQPEKSYQPRARSLHHRVRVPSCDELSCDSNALLPQDVVELSRHAKPRIKAKTLPVVAKLNNPARKALQRSTKAAGVKIAGKAAAKLQKVAARNKAEDQARVKSERKIALRRFKETPAEISYRSFVGSFVPAS